MVPHASKKLAVQKAFLGSIIQVQTYVSTKGCEDALLVERYPKRIAH